MKLLVCIGIALFLLLVAGSCKKEVKTFTITGRLLRSCNDKTPVTNMRMHGFGSKGGGLFCADTNLEDVVTDGNGFFTFSYENKGCAKQISLFSTDTIRGNSINIVESIKPFENINLGDIFLTNIKPFVYEITTDSIFSAADTLFYNIEYLFSRDSTFNFLTGPFTNNQSLLRDTFGGVLFFSKIENVHLVDLERGWLLKSGKRVYKKGFNNEIFKPCTENKVIIDLTK